MQDVANRANVSAMTVSRVLNGLPGVSPATAHAVTTAAEAIGYRKNELARSLRPGQQSKTIALVIGDISNPYYGVMAQAIETEARNAGFALVIMSTNEEPAAERSRINDLLARRVDGVILVTCDASHQYLARDLESGVAIVFVDRPPQDLKADTVLANDRIGGHAATEELLLRGHTSIGYLGDYDHVHTATERLAGFFDAMKESAIEPRFVQMGVHTRGVAERVVRGWLNANQPPTALVAGNNLIASGAQAAVSSMAVDTELVGFDFLPDSKLRIRIGHDVAALGARAAERLFEQMAGVDREPTTDVFPLQISRLVDGVT
ncbi:MAG: LacI family DNA-binding transcriptional regulator [Lentisphaeria bacterium]|nr:LacI family DNA-binding transcriptional regulator [Lentisphaeria bacterium]